MYIVFEGVNGSGKTTMTRKTAEWLRSIGIDVDTVKEPLTPEKMIAFPKDCKLSEKDKRLIEIINYAKSREKLNGLVEMHRKDKSVLLSDRSFISTIAYQGEVEFTEFMNKLVPLPDLVIYFKVIPEIAINRIKGRDLENWLTLKYCREVQKRYEKYMEDNPISFCTINVDNEENVVFDAVKEVIRTFLLGEVVKEIKVGMSL